MDHPILTGPAAVLLAAALTACGPSPAPPPEADPASRRELAQGAVVGFVGDYGGHVWQGVPYAAPPQGARRWRAPQPPVAWSGTRQALAPGDPCSQLGSPIGGVRTVDPGEPAGSEDCLYLNVHAPAMPAESVPTGADRLPVMVWLHGGGNVVGHGALYDGGRLAAEHGVVVVTVNYRLGPFGWFRHAALRDTGATPAERSGNFALLDQIRALEWTRDNIAAFGGDPGNVTVFGESAGGRNIAMLLLSPLAEGLFHRAVIQSGGIETTPPAAAENFADAAEPGQTNSSNEALARMMIADGRVDDRVAVERWLDQAPPSDIAAYLRTRPAEALLRAYAPDRPGGLSRVPQAFADGTVLPAADPLERLADPEGRNRVPVLIGGNRDEMKLFLYVDPTWVKHVLWILPRLREPELYDVVAEYTSRQWLATGVHAPAAALASDPDRAVYAYRFDWDEEPTVLGADLSRMLGAAHGLEIPFVFGHWVLGEVGDRLFTEGNRPGRESLSERMRRYWVRFARDGDPNADGLPPWPAWTPDRPVYRLLDTTEDGEPGTAEQVWSVAGLAGSVEDDPRLRSHRERCVVYRAMAAFGRGFTREDYGRTDCGDYPYADYPWREGRSGPD